MADRPPAGPTGDGRGYAPGMSDVRLTPSGPPETILDPEPADAVAALASALGDDDPLVAVGRVCERWPRYLDAWARLGELAPTRALAYAAFRTGYHRGLDRLRADGWRGSGYVRWDHETNRGFLRALDGLRATAAAIGEHEEEARCAVFLRQLDPAWPPAERTDPDQAGGGQTRSS
jgi:hypothetical protein